MSTDMKYIHPHTESRIIDNAVLTVSASGLSNKFIALEAEKGMPNEATYISSSSEYTFNFGEPNYSKYGQSGLNAIQWLRAGGGLWVIRVVPDDETFAGLSVGIGYRRDCEFANDEPEFKSLEMTENQIAVHNLDDVEHKFSRGRASGNSTLLPKYYPAKQVKGIWKPDTKRGLMTADEMAILNESEETPFAAYAGRQIQVVSNSSLGFKFKATVKGESQTLYPTADPTAVGETGYFYVFNKVAGFNEESSSAKTYYSTLGSEASKVTAIKLADASATAVVTVSAKFGTSDNDIEDIVDTFTNGSTRTATITIPENSILNRLSDLELPANGVHTSALITLFKNAAKVEGVEGLVAITSGNDFATWELSYELYEKISFKDSNNSAVRPLSVNELRVLSANMSNPNGWALPAMTETEFKDWLFEGQLDNEVYFIGKQFAQSNGVVTTVEGIVIVTAEGNEVATGENPVTPPLNIEAVITAPSTGIYDRQKLYFVVDASGEVVDSTGMTIAESAVFNQANAGKDRLAAIEEGEDPKYIVSTRSNAKLSKGFVDYTATSISSSVVTKNMDENTYGADENNKFAIQLLKFFGNEIGGYDFMTFSISDEDDTTSVKFDFTNGYVSQRQFAKLNAVYQVLFDTHGNLKTSIAEGEFPYDLKLGSYRLLGETLYKLESGNYELNTTEAASWEIVLRVNKTLAGLLAKSGSDEGIIECEFDDESVPAVQLHYVPEYKGAIVDGEGNFAIKFVFGATAFESEYIVTLAGTEDSSYPIAISGKSTGEYVYYPEYSVSTVYVGISRTEDKEPNAEYAHGVYDTIGLVSTSYSEFETHYAQYDVNDVDVAKERAEAFKGYIVGTDRDKITPVTVTDMKPDAAVFAEFIRFLPKGSGKWYNRLSVSFSYDDSMDKTYTEWSMFRLTISEKLDGGEVSREAYNVSFDPDAVSNTKESLFIEDVVNRYSKYLTCVVNYDNLINFIDAKIGGGLKDPETGKTVTDEDGNEIIIPIDAVIKYIFNQITLDELNDRIFGDGFRSTDLVNYKITNLMSSIGYDNDLCHLDTTLYEDGVRMYSEPFVSLYIFKNVTNSNSNYLGGGSYGHGWGYEHFDDDGNPINNSTLEQALIKAYNGTTDAIITNINLCVFDMVMDCNYPVPVKTAMNDLSSVIRQDCVTILDQGISTANAQQAIDMRKNQMQYDTFYTSIFTQHLEITDEWSGKPVKVTPTFFLASKIPLNDTAYSPAVNFVGPNRGAISGFNSVSWMPTEPEKDQLYRNQLNYIERDNIATMFATELTSQTKNTPLTLIHAVRTLLRLEWKIQFSRRA